MSDDTPKKPFDLASLIAPVQATLPALGTVALHIRTVSFLKWLEEGERRKRWPSGVAFVQAFLEDRISPIRQDGDAPQNDSDPTPLEPALVQNLDPDKLEEIAVAILPIASPILQYPRKARSAEENEEGQADEAFSSPIKEDAPATERLRQLALHYLTSYIEASRERQKQAGAMLTRFEKMTSLGSSLDSILKQQKKLNDIMRAIDAYRPQSLIPELSILKASERLLSSSLLREQDTFARRMKLLDSPYLDLIKKTDALSKIGALGNLTALTEAQNKSSLWASSMSNFLNLGLSRKVIGAVGAVGALTAGEMLASQVVMEAAGVLRPGFQSVADLAMEGIVARGAAADLLHSYDVSAIDAAPLFAAVLDCVTVLDDPKATEGERISRLNAVILALNKLPGFLKAEYQKAGLIALISLMIGILGVVPSLRVWEDADPSQEIRKATAEIKSIRTDMQARQTAAEAEHARTRYVHRASNLRAQPDRSGVIVRLVYPDQWVHVIDAKGEWARVQVFDYQSVAPVEGWISRRNLRVNPE